MADTDWGAIAGLVAKLINQGYTEKEATDIAQQSFAQAGANLAQQRADFAGINLPQYQLIDPASTQLPDTELKGIQQDAQGRQAQLDTMAGLQDVIGSGGLTLADMAALNKQQGAINRGVQANRQSLANQYAARGQLGSGAMLAMDLANNQDAAMRANEVGESTAAQAQARALQALLQRGQFGRAMANDTYGQKSDAARAADAIRFRNSQFRTDAIRGNNQALDQGYQDQLSRARGMNGIADKQLGLIQRQGAFGYDNRVAQGAATNGAIDQGVKAWGGFSGGGQSNAGGTSASDSAAGNDTLWNEYPDSREQESPSKLGDDEDK